MAKSHSRGPVAAHEYQRGKWVEAAEDIAEGLARYPSKDAAFRAAMAAFEATDPDAAIVEEIIRSKWDAPDWSLQSVALAAFKAGQASARQTTDREDGK